MEYFQAIQHRTGQTVAVLNQFLPGFRVGKIRLVRGWLHFGKAVTHPLNRSAQKLGVGKAVALCEGNDVTFAVTVKP